jgi:hypothetical protein
VTEYHENAATDNARKQLAENRKEIDRMKGDYKERSKGRPTPTQEENDMAALGAHIHKHEDDGSGPDPYTTRHIEARPGGDYRTRDSTAGPAHRDTTARRPAPPAPAPRE